VYTKTIVINTNGFGAGQQYGEEKGATVRSWKNPRYNMS